MTAGTPAAEGGWEGPPPRPAGTTLIVELAGYEGPLDLLLDLARSQKVDLARLSILALAEQYLAFISGARALRLEIAADYLVMAAWLAYLKSRLLLPEPPLPDEPTGEELAIALALRLRRLEAMRRVADLLAARPRLGRDVFARGEPEASVTTRHAWSATLHDLLSAYAGHRLRQGVRVMTVPKREVWSLADARAAIARMVGGAAEWTPLNAFLSPYLGSGTDPDRRRTVTASSFAAVLELVRDGTLNLRQSAPFGPIYVRGGAAREGAPDG